jgi:hypothetical protein
MISYRMSFATAGNISILAIFWLIAYATREPHLFQRSGALVAAFAAILVIIQVLDEIKFEEQRSKILGIAEQEMETNITQLIGSEEVESRLRQKVYRSRADALRRRRIGTAVAAAVCVFFGEVVSGYGDLMVPISVPAR